MAAGGIKSPEIVPKSVFAVFELGMQQISELQSFEKTDSTFAVNVRNVLLRLQQS